MSEELYRKGYQDGWFYDPYEQTDPDYIEGLRDGKKAREQSEIKRRERCFSKETSCKTTTS
jgi:hypothetical protein